MDSVEFSLYLVKNSLIDRADDRFKTIMQWKDVDLFRQPLSFLFPADAHGRVDRLLESRSQLFKDIVFFIFLPSILIITGLLSRGLLLIFSRKMDMGWYFKGSFVLICFLISFFESLKRTFGVFK